MKRYNHLILFIIVIALVLTLFIEEINAIIENVDMGYINTWNKASYINLIDKTNNSINVVSPNYFAIDEDGDLSLTSLIDQDFIDEMHKREIKVTPFLMNNWDRELGRLCLQNRVNFANQVADAIEKYSLDGINVDIENVTDEDRDAYTDFIRLLNEKLPEDKTVSVAVAANPYNWNTGWQGSYDYISLANYSDYLVIMTYDEHWHTSTEGPVASIGWVKKSIDYAVKKGIAGEKIVLGVPFYGRIWSNDNSNWDGEGLSLKKAEELIERYNGQVIYDEEKQTPKVIFTVKPGEESKIYDSHTKELTAGTYTIWYENEQSLKSKLDLIKEYNLRGVAAWAIGYEPERIWEWYDSWMNESEENKDEPQDVITKERSYDKNGILKQTLEYLNGVLKYKKIYTEGNISYKNEYNENGDRIAKYIYYKDENGNYRYKYKFVYNNDGELTYKLEYIAGKVVAKYTYYKDSEGSYRYKYKYVYNSKQTLIKKLEYQSGKVIAKYTYYKDYKGDYRYKYKYVYDSNGNLKYKYEYSYGKKVAKFTYYKDNEGNYRYQYKYAYNENGSLNYKNKYDDGKRIAKYTYYKDEKGKYRYKYKYIYDNGKLLYKYEYDNGKKVAKYTYYKDEKGSYRYKYKYIYNSTGTKYIKRYTYNNGKIISTKNY